MGTTGSPHVILMGQTHKSHIIQNYSALPPSACEIKKDLVRAIRPQNRWASARFSDPEGEHDPPLQLSDGQLDPRAPPLLTWYLNGEQQTKSRPPPKRGRRVMAPPRDDFRDRPNTQHPNSTFSLKVRRWDRELLCVASNPQTGQSYNATVSLNIQFQPEILKVKAQYSETADPGLSLVLFALVRSNPPATLSFVDQTGHVVANTSDFLILDSHNYPWLTNHSLRVALNSLSGNMSLNADNGLGTSSCVPSEFLQSRVEVPMLGIVTGGAMAFMALLILSLIVLCLMQKNKSKTIGKTRLLQSVSEKTEKPHMPRENMSLPSNMQLNDLGTLRRGTTQLTGILYCPLLTPGFARYPMVGYIYKVNSTSSEEIWL
uniref:Transmembrane protein 25 n=1 Tax=Neogobius melanostomus TaxID=47308 RepID=A0A8C6TJ09_9GOBI